MSIKNASRVALICGLVAVVGGVGAGTAAAQDGCHPDARDLEATYQPVSHSADATAVQARLTLSNASRRCALPASGWKLYFNFVRQPLAAGPPGDVADAARAQLAGQGLTLAHGDAAQSGDLYVLTPTSDFQPIAPGAWIVVRRPPTATTPGTARADAGRGTMRSRRPSAISGLVFSA